MRCSYPRNVLSFSAKLSRRLTTPHPNYAKNQLQSRLFTSTSKTERNSNDQYMTSKTRLKKKLKMMADKNEISPAPPKIFSEISLEGGRNWQGEQSTDQPQTWGTLKKLLKSEKIYRSSRKKSPTLKAKESDPRGPWIPFKALQRDRINPPSAESGGIPEPSQSYLDYASHPPFVLPDPRVILIVLDLNGTLIFRPSKENPHKFVLRPYAFEFLAYCIRTFKVAIWSSARIKNIIMILNKILTEEQRSRLVGVWGREHFGLSQDDFKSRTMCYKRLTKLWDDPAVQATHPDAGLDKRWDQTNTLLIDDSVEKARSEPFNLVQISEFLGNPTETGYVIPQVHDYINECSRQLNISSYIKQKPFVPDYNFVLEAPKKQW
ncbi:HAD-like domain-containing protein [Annulohypoxylon maeteangense]|uniref:HAD-like domain-containing protein n=1 Tax=Annulohypoxylon maeteangense TaxID=1927788 RepID=UPI002007E4FF|nr:HAD-like domain-containing protein [Annulohypoxylon maeteangense]KAI0885130.1 HAD-like domain-containing protein [Annulohypoxylon maeteangense]